MSDDIRPAAVREGGCMCRSVRYRLTGEPLDAALCHCRMCQQSAGAPVVAWATFRATQVELLEGQPLTYRSSPEAQRAFCGGCGTQLWFVTDGAPGLVDITLASLDEPESLPPQYHIWTMSQLSWLKLADDLPRHIEGGPDVQLMATEGGSPPAS